MPIDTAQSGFTKSKLKLFTLSEEGTILKHDFETNKVDENYAKETIYRDKKTNDRGAKNSLYEKHNQTRENMTKVRIIFRKHNQN